MSLFQWFLLACGLVVLAVRGAEAQWGAGRLGNPERWQTEEPQPRREYGVGQHDPLVQKYLNDAIEPGHIPYPCGHITSPAARRDCQENWQAQNPNDYLRYGR